MPSDPADEALATLFQPLAEGLLDWPAEGGVLFLRARPGLTLSQASHPGLVCEQEFKPLADALARAALDTVAQTHVLNTLQTARTRTGAALILITHDLTVAANHTDRVLVMHAGHPVELGTTAEILYHPCTHHTTAPPSATHPDRPTAQPAENDDPAGPGQRALRQSTVSGSPVLEIRGLVKHYSQGKGWFPGRAAAAVRAVDPHLDVEVNGTAQDWVARVVRRGEPAPVADEVAVTQISSGAAFTFEPRRSLPITPV